MAQYLLDTNIVSFLVRGTYPVLTRRIRLMAAEDLSISAVIEAEIRFGLELMPLEAKTRIAALDFLDSVIIHPWDSHCAVSYASLNAKQQRLGKTLATMDTMIAAHALAYDLVLVSNDAAFRQVKGLKLEDWTKGPRRA